MNTKSVTRKKKRPAVRTRRVLFALLAAAAVVCLFFGAEAIERAVKRAEYVPLTAEEIDRRKIKTVGLLATDGTIQTGIYERLFGEHGVAVVKPDAAGQKRVMALIYDGVKAGNAAFDTTPVRVVLDAMLALGVETFVLGCKELPIAFADYALPYPVVDPTAVLARAAIEFAGCKVKDV